MAIVYIVTNKINGKSYIGKTVKQLNKRKSGHIAAMKRGVKTHFYSALRGTGIDSFDWDVLEEVPEDQLDDAEIFWIAYFKYIGAGLYNHCNGGEGSKGVKWSDESRKRQSERYKGKPGNNKGRKWSEESRKKMIGNKNGKPGRTKEFRNMVGSMFARTHNITLVSPEGIEYSNIYNMMEFCRQHNIARHGIDRVINLGQKQYKGWKLKTDA